MVLALILPYTAPLRSFSFNLTSNHQVYDLQVATKAFGDGEYVFLDFFLHVNTPPHYQGRILTRPIIVGLSKFSRSIGRKPLEYERFQSAPNPPFLPACESMNVKGFN
jgi:hypothetical protein